MKQINRLCERSLRNVGRCRSGMTFSVWLLLWTGLLGMWGQASLEARELVSGDTSMVSYSGSAWFNISIFDEVSLTIYVENQPPDEFLDAIQIECKLFLKNGQLAQTDKYPVRFSSAIPP